jgi:hypothetical protein
LYIIDECTFSASQSPIRYIKKWSFMQPLIQLNGP